MTARSTTYELTPSQVSTVYTALQATLMDSRAVVAEHGADSERGRSIQEQIANCEALLAVIRYPTTTMTMTRNEYGRNA